jgi:hypothetical protein
MHTVVKFPMPGVVQKLIHIRYLMVPFIYKRNNVRVPFSRLEGPTVFVLSTSFDAFGPTGNEASPLPFLLVLGELNLYLLFTFIRVYNPSRDM